MKPAETMQVESEALKDFALIMQQEDRLLAQARDNAPPRGARLELDPERLKNGLGQLVLTVVKLLHELLERQALRRIDAGSLTEAQIERIGLTLMGQAEEIERLRKEFGLEEDDLNLDLGPLGKMF